MTMGALNVNDNFKRKENMIQDCTDSTFPEGSKRSRMQQHQPRVRPEQE